MKNLVKIFVVGIFALGLLLVTRVMPVLADTQVQIINDRWELPSVQQQDNAVRDCATGDKNCLERNTYSLINGSLPGSLLCTSLALACGPRSPAELNYFQRKSVLAQSTIMIASLYAQPAATTSEFCQSSPFGKPFATLLIFC